jgi:hypothetical protein
VRAAERAATGGLSGEGGLDGAKACPRCGVFVAKDGGCCAMRCANDACAASFFWCCMLTAEQAPRHPHVVGTRGAACPFGGTYE